jgi:hypothetical protein
MELLVLVIGLIALDVLAVRFGYDSRDHMHDGGHGRGTPVGHGSNPTHEQELARELRQARQRRLARGQAADILPHDECHFRQAA